MSNSLIPELIVTDFQKSIQFYAQILEFTIDYDRPEKKFAMLSFEGNQLMINEKNGFWETGELKYPLGIGINLQIKTTHIEKLLKNLKKFHIDLFQEVEENWYKKDEFETGHREFLIQDPDGYLLRFAQFLGIRNIK